MIVNGRFVRLTKTQYKQLVQSNIEFTYLQAKHKSEWADIGVDVGWD